MKFWQMAHWVEVEQLPAFARFAEELGFEGVMLPDHALLPLQVDTPYPYAPDGRAPMRGDEPYPDVWSALAAIAAATSRLRLSTAVYVLPLRHPVEVARACATLDRLSGGRFALGAGVGWMKEEFDVLGVDFASRGRRMDEAIPLLRRLWCEAVVEHRGACFSFPALAMNPRPASSVPIWIGGDSPAAIRRAATLGDGWIGVGYEVDGAAAMLASLREQRREAGREGDPFEAIVPLGPVPDRAELERLRELGMTAGVSYPVSFNLGPHSTLDEKKRALEHFSERVMRVTPMI